MLPETVRLILLRKKVMRVNELPVSLRYLKKKDVQGMLEWMHDADINQFFRFDAEHMTEEKAEKFVEDSIKAIKKKTSYNYAVVDGTDCYLGTISLKNVDWDAKSAEYAISLRKTAQGKGIAAAATSILLEDAFKKLELNRIFLNVLSENKGAIRMYEKFGFVYEGEFRQHVFLKGRTRDLKWYSILKDEYVNHSCE